MVEQAKTALPGVEKDEQFLFSIRQHWVRLVPAALAAAGWTILLFLTSFLQFIGVPFDDPTRHLLLIVLGFLFLYFQLRFIWRWYQYLLHVIVVTDKRVHRFKQRFLLMEDQRSFEMSSLQDIRKDKAGVVGRLLGFGTITLVGEKSNMPLHFVTMADAVYNKLVSLRDAMQMKRVPPAVQQRVESAIAELKPIVPAQSA